MHDGTDDFGKAAVLHGVITKTNINSPSEKAERWLIFKLHMGCSHR